MKKSESFRNKYKLYIIYTIIMILFGLWQIIDWWVIRAGNDPIWHVIFYLAFMPFVSFIFGVVMGNTHKWRAFPIYALIITSFVFLFFANGGFKISMNFDSILGYGFLYIICPSVLAAVLGVIITRIVLLLGYLLKHKK